MPDEILNNTEPETETETETGTETGTETETGTGTETEAEESAMLAAVKTAMHISGDDMDGALAADIAAAVMDMQRVGVAASTDSTAPLVIKCVELWCKASIDYLGRGAQFLSCYRALRDSMSLCADYQPQPEVDGNGI